MLEKLINETFKDRFPLYRFEPSGINGCMLYLLQNFDSGRSISCGISVLYNEEVEKLEVEYHILEIPGNGDEPCFLKHDKTNISFNIYELSILATIIKNVLTEWELQRKLG